MALINWDHGIKNLFSHENVDESSWKHEAECWNLEETREIREVMQQTRCNWKREGTFRDK